MENMQNAPRGTEGMAFGQVIDANKYYSAPPAENEATPFDSNQPVTEQPPAPHTGVTDDAPILAEVSSTFAGDTLPDGVDVDSLPPFKDMRRVLPSVRVKVQMNTAKIATGLPDHLKDVSTADFNNLTSDDADAIATMIERVETAVLDNAKDKDAMTEWLISQENQFDALMFAFDKFAGALGN